MMNPHFGRWRTRGPSPADRVRWDQLAEKVFRLIDQHEGFPDHDAAAKLLYRYYRWLSTWESHGSLGSLTGHWSAGSGAVRFERTSHDTSQLIRLGGTFTGVLALLLLEKTSSDTEDKIEQLVGEVLDGRSVRELFGEIMSQGVPVTITDSSL